MDIKKVIGICVKDKTVAVSKKCKSEHCMIFTFIAIWQKSQLIEIMTILQFIYKG